MFDYINGILADITTGENSSVTIDVNGVGYLISVTEKDIHSMPEINAKVKIFTILLHKEDSMSLCGFLQKDARNLFKIITGVSGVGSKMGIQILNTFSPQEFISIILNENAKELTMTKGIGKKLAQKIIIELKDKLSNLQNSVPVILDSTAKTFDESAVNDAQAVLISLGYEAIEIKSAIEYSLNYADAKATAEDILKLALKFLSEE